MFMFIVKSEHTLNARLIPCNTDGHCGCSEYGQLFNVVARDETDCIAILERHLNGSNGFGFEPPVPNADVIAAAVKRAERFRIQTDTAYGIVAELTT